MRVLRFQNTKELLRYLEAEVNSTKSLIEELEARIQVLKNRTEIISRVESVLKELTLGQQTKPQEVRVGGVRILLNPHPREELKELEEALNSLISKLKALQDARDSLNPLAGIGEERIDIEVLEDNGLPRTLIIRV